VLRNGTLVLLPFPAAAYRQDVHSAAYRCVASNSVGRVLSRDVQVRAGERNAFETPDTVRDRQLTAQMTAREKWKAERDAYPRWDSVKRQ